MRINCHAHIFNLQSVFTMQTLETLINRIVEIKLPGFIEDALKEVLTNIISRADNTVDEEQVVRNFLKIAKKSDGFSGLMDRLPPLERDQLEATGIDRLDELAVTGLMNCLAWIESKLSQQDSDARKTTVVDVIEFIRVGIQPNIRNIAGILMEQLSSDDAVIALTMDITQDGSEKELFEKQIEETSGMVLAYPGRLFPFIAVNPNRPDHYQIMVNALQGRGFVGVKLYPSLGYNITSPAMDRIYTYCEENRVPILMHCSKGGFFKNKDSINNSSPDFWEEILKNHNRLKICFGHFGGGENLTKETIPTNSWTDTILKLMKHYPGVYADIAYHTEPMDGGDSESNYFKIIKQLLSDSVFGTRFLFGTDFFLVRARLKEESFWNYFEKRFSEPEFLQMVDRNAREFLGLRKPEAAPEQNITNYFRFLYSSRDRIESKPAAWVEQEIKVIFGEAATMPEPGLGTRWAWGNRVHARTWIFMKEQMRPEDKGLSFEEAGKLRLRQMQYWNREFEDKSIWDQKRAAMAENLDSAFWANKAHYGYGYDEGKALGLLEEVFDKGDLALYELATACEQIYKFER